MIPMLQIPLESLHFGRALESARLGVISLALTQSKGNRSHAATSLGIHRNTLARHMQELGLNSWPGGERGRRPKR